ncbi:efflux RND transporter periplasmic adaptor subunit [uncultured Odoribacter sp.]|uniref:efflux RND transporter periplasmic adaptor subunit n=1 Tax=uncultured Odoribacter sp. TaxID=876416 RepID=UPI00261F7DA4|nr:efflux RND transporter periplasmic adaptor subunit [uncultured Odoribacter sp.]
MKKTFIRLIIVTGFMLLWGACRQKTTPLTISQLVKTTEVKAYQGLFKVTYPGKLQAASDVKLAFRVAGPIKDIYVHEGEYVRKGKLLARLDPRDYQLQYDAAYAEYIQVKGESERIMQLYQKKSVPVNEYDKAVAALKRVSALYNGQKNALEDTRLRAPFDGYIQNKYFDAYEIVNQGTPVLSMINNDYLEVSIDIPSVDYIRQEDFAEFSCIADVYPDDVLPLEFLDITRKANFNQLFKVRFRLKREPKQKLNLAAGMSVSVTIQYIPFAEDLSIIPISALFWRDYRSYVWLFDANDGKVRMMPVDVKRVLKDGEVIVESDLRPGETIVSAGVNDLKEGQVVRVLPPVPSSNVGKLL